MFNQMLLLLNSVLPPPPFFFAIGSPIDCIHEPAELSQNKLHRLKFDNPFMRSASLISGWWLSLAPLQRRGKVARWRRPSTASSNCIIASSCSGCIVLQCHVRKLKLVAFCSKQREEHPPPLFPAGNSTDLGLFQRIQRVSEICPAVWSLTLQWQRSNISPLVSEQITSRMTSDGSQGSQTPSSHTTSCPSSQLCGWVDPLSIIQCMNIIFSSMLWISSKIIRK